MADVAQIRKLTKALNTESEASRAAALRSIKQNEAGGWAELPADAVTPLVQALAGQLNGKGSVNGNKGRLPTYRQEVVVILGNLGARAEAAVPRLLEMLEDGEPQALREAAIVALGKIGPKAKSAADRLLRMLVPGCRDALVARVARALGDMGTTNAGVHTRLSELWCTPGLSESCREQIALSLCKLNVDAPGLRFALTKALTTSSHLSARKIAAEALACLDPDSVGVVPALVIAMHDADDEVKRLAAAGLKRMKLSDTQAISRCGDQLEECFHAEAALRKSGANAVPTLINALGHRKAAVREKAAQVLGSLGEAGVEAGKALRKALKDKSAEVRLCSAKALWNTTKQAEDVVPVLGELLKEKKEGDADPEEKRRFTQSVIEALGRIGPPALSTVPALTKQLRNPNRLIRESALRTIKQIDPNAKIAV